MKRHFLEDRCVLLIELYEDSLRAVGPSVCSLGRLASSLIGGPEHVYQGERDREHDRTKHDSQNAKDLQTSEHGKEDQKFVQLGAATDQLRP